MNKFPWVVALFLFFSSVTLAQQRADTITRTVYSLDQCIDFALRNQPQVKQASIDEAINEKDIRIGLSAWLPQVVSNNTATHYYKGGPVIAGGITSGAAAEIKNTSVLGVQATQVIYNNDVFLASRASRFSRESYRENTLISQVNVVSDVSKAFYDVLLSEKQLDIVKADIIRLQRSLKDAYARYQGGVVDKTDYKQATIALNNALANRKQIEEGIKAKAAYLKQTMGLAPEKPLQLQYDSARYEREAVVDTNQVLMYTSRPEYRQLQANKNLRDLNVSYYRWGFLPSLSANGAYNYNFFSGRLGDLYNSSIQNAYVGLTLNIPIFTGTRRLQNLAKARLQSERTDLDIINLQNSINTEYSQALASYKSSYYNWQLLRQNVALANDVYRVVSLQYREGIKTYLDVIVAQSDLRAAELSYINALFQLLASKIDLQRALGTLTPNTVTTR